MSVVYALIDPIDFFIRYIGQTASPEQRFKEHLNCKQQRNRKEEWIALLLLKRLKPNLVILEVCSRENVSLRERYYISLFSATLYQKDNYVHREHNDLKKSLLISGQSALSVAGAMGINPQYVYNVVNNPDMNTALAERIRTFIYGCEPDPLTSR